MDLSAIKKKAQGLGVDTARMAKMKKADLVRAIQTAEGNTACYASRTEGCPYVLCCFMVDCYKDAKAAQKPATGATKGKGRK